MIVKHELGNTGTIYQAAKMIRLAVFVDEQGIDPKLEFDPLDATLVHYVGYVADEPVTTARLAPSSSTVKVQRVATLPEYRGQHLASELLRTILAAQPAGTEVTLNAQQTAIGLYERLGFKPVGAPFEEVGILHQAMVLTIEA
ncbi:GNAT family N-acetyltransferase [Secundilactobacillus kimchicus]|uniref:GNAT family N-acetyltransferase n=1 Tax=Secundilactobacillus kimchicus TaxID=528209 RepID=UPI001C00C495|nr:GNAT family N-acetyltransferase [Secundilactobacillus kimchicus]MBT9672008.1 GNAT family N-acetyltransferase [Secundilactobacillus kimchicus]